MAFVLLTQHLGSSAHFSCSVAALCSLAPALGVLEVQQDFAFFSIIQGHELKEHFHIRFQLIEASPGGVYRSSAQLALPALCCTVKICIHLPRKIRESGGEATCTVGWCWMAVGAPAGSLPRPLAQSFRALQPSSARSPPCHSCSLGCPAQLANGTRHPLLLCK